MVQLCRHKGCGNLLQTSGTLARKQGMDLVHVSDLGAEVQESMALLLNTMHVDAQQKGEGMAGLHRSKGKGPGELPQKHR